MFRRFLMALVALNLVLPAGAFAAGTSKSKKRAKTATSRASRPASKAPSNSMSARATTWNRLPREEMMKGFGLGLVMSSVSKSGELKGETRTNMFGFPMTSAENFGGGSGSQGQAGVNFNYSWVPRMGLGFTADATLSQVKELGIDDNYLYLRPAGNLAFGFMDHFYLIGGANYLALLSEATYTEESPYAGQAIKLQGQVGFQVGGGFVWKEKWQGQIQYVQSSQKVDQDMDVSKFSGLVESAKITGQYDLSMIEVMLQYRF